MAPLHTRAVIGPKVPVSPFKIACRLQSLTLAAVESASSYKLFF
jgi:hypothetical protein